MQNLDIVHKNNTFFLILLSIFGPKLLTAITIFPVYCHIKYFIAAWTPANFLGEIGRSWREKVNKGIPAVHIP